MHKVSVLAVPLMLIVVGACTSGPAATPTLAPTAAPPTQVPTAEPTAPAPPTGAATDAPATSTPGGVAGADCAGVPTFSLENPEPSFATDPQLAAAFPQTIDGQPVTGLNTVRFLDFMCMLVGQQGVDQFKAQSQGVDLATLSFGSAAVMVGDQSVQLIAFRTATQDAAALSQSFQQLASIAGAEAGDAVTVTTSSVGGKSVTVLTDSAGEVTYLYASGDVLWGLSDVTEEQAATILAALP